MFPSIQRKIRSLVRGDAGALLTEHFLLISLIAVVGMVAVAQLGPNVENLFSYFSPSSQVR